MLLFTLSGEITDSSVFCDTKRPLVSKITKIALIYLQSHRFHESRESHGSHWSHESHESRQSHVFCVSISRREDIMPASQAGGENLDYNIR